MRREASPCRTLFDSIFQQRQLSSLLSFLSFCSTPAEPILPFSNRGHERKRFFLTFLSRFFLLPYSAAWLSSTPTQIGRTLSHRGRTLTDRSTPANWIIAGPGDQRGLRVGFFSFSAFAWTDVAAGFIVLFAVQHRWPHHGPQVSTRYVPNALRRVTQKGSRGR
jgi:hypothetical protein